MRYTNYTVNEAGMAEINDFLDENHKKGGGGYFTHDMLLAWAADAESQLARDNPPSIEIRAWDSIHGRTQEFTISMAGIDSEEIEIEESQHAR